MILCLVLPRPPFLADHRLLSHRWQDGKLPLHLALENRVSEDVILELLTKKPEADCVGEMVPSMARHRAKGYMPLHLALKKESTLSGEAIIQLLDMDTTVAEEHVTVTEKGADDDKTPLHLAIKLWQEKVTDKRSSAADQNAQARDRQRSSVTFALPQAQPARQPARSYETAVRKLINRTAAKKYDKVSCYNTRKDDPSFTLGILPLLVATEWAVAIAHRHGGLWQREDHGS